MRCRLILHDTNISLFMRYSYSYTNSVLNCDHMSCELRNVAKIMASLV